MDENIIKTGSETYSSAIEHAHNYTKWVLSPFTPYIGKSVLEVGLGHGGYKEYLPDNIKYIGIDIDTLSINKAKSKYPNDIFMQGDITDSSIKTTLNNINIDSILCINVLEHIENDSLCIKNMLDILQEGGHLFLFIPAFQHIYNELDAMAGHFRRYTKKSISSLIPENGQVVHCKYFNALGGIGWWLNGFIKHNSLNTSAMNNQIVIFDKYILPISKILDHITNKYFGQSLICIVKKV